MADSAEEKPERLFIGVPLTDAARDAIAKALPRTLPGKLVPPENWHFTLRFLGSTARDAREKMVTALRAASYPKRFEISFNGLGAFPSARRARILWLGADRGADKLGMLATIAEQGARSAGFTPEARAFTAHLTLSRIDPLVSVAALVTSKPRFNIPMRVDRIVLFRSRLGGGPARYEEVETFTLP